MDSLIAASAAVFVDETGVGAYQVRVRTVSSDFVADEPPSAGGLGTGPNPYELLSAALGACTVMTMRMYALRKGLAVSGLRVRVSHRRDRPGTADVFSKEIQFDGGLSEHEQKRLLEIAGRCPVHLTLARGSSIETVRKELIAEDDMPAVSRRVQEMEQACQMSQNPDD